MTTVRYPSHAVAPGIGDDPMMSPRLLRRIVPAVSLFTACLLYAQDAARPDLARMDQVVQSYVAGKRFMGTVLVAQGDKILLDKGYGYANLEWQIPDAPEAKFRLGSITKQFTAASILLLEERGKLSTSDLVKKYIPRCAGRVGQGHHLQPAHAYFGHSQLHRLPGLPLDRVHAHHA